MGVETPKCRSLAFIRRARPPRNGLCGPRYTFMHEVAPSAVTIAVHTDAMI